ncbi:MAG: acetyl-CoA carboxylase biotin carboxyl carrier protein [Fidelibacterota bacterium]
MWQDRLKHIIELLEASSVNEIEVSFWGRKFRVSKGNTSEENVGPVRETEQGGTQGATLPAATAEASDPEAVEEVRGVEIRAPMVGTFYRGPSPDTSPFADVGDHVTVGQTVCIIEAMKIMNEIESEVTGRVARILVENAQPVEYGHPLFVIEPD